MGLSDERGVELSTSSRASVELYEKATELLAGYYVDPLAVIDQALAAEPDFAAGLCLKAGAALMAAERATEPLLRESVDAGLALGARANARERRHFAAARAWLDGEFHRSSELYGSIVLDYPRDLLALQVAHFGDFALGQQRLLRDRVAQVLPRWDKAIPGHHFVLGMLAFGLEETNLFAKAEAAGLQALALERRDPWAIHAVAHVYEMTGQLERGVAFLEEYRDDFARDGALAYHNFWHLALFELARCNTARVLELYDSVIYPGGSRAAMELVDASALLFRLYLAGVDVGGRAARLADVWSDPSYHGHYAFNDAHALMAFVIDGRLADARKLLGELERRAADASSNAMMTREVGLPLAQALLDFAEGRYARVVEALLPLRLVAHRFGGSNAQRDVIELTLLEACERSGKRGYVEALRAERALSRGALVAA